MKSPIHQPVKTVGNVGPPKFCSEKLFVDVLGEQQSRSAENPFTLTENTIIDIISENEKDWRNVLVPQSVSRASLLPHARAFRRR